MFLFNENIIWKLKLIFYFKRRKNLIYHENKLKLKLLSQALEISRDSAPSSSGSVSRQHSKSSNESSPPLLPRQQSLQKQQSLQQQQSLQPQQPLQKQKSLQQQQPLKQQKSLQSQPSLPERPPPPFAQPSLERQHSGSHQQHAPPPTHASPSHPQPHSHTQTSQLPTSQHAPVKQTSLTAQFPMGPPPPVPARSPAKISNVYVPPVPAASSEDTHTGL